MEKMLENRTFDELELGDSASISKVLTPKDIQLFAVMSGDVNPAHLDEEFAASDFFHGIVGHGMWGASLISTVLGTQLPGPGTIYLNQSLNFVRPVKVGDRISAQVTVKEKVDAELPKVRLACQCINQEGKAVIEGEAWVIAPNRKIRRPQVKLPQWEVKQDEGRFFVPLIESARQAFSEHQPALRTAVVHPVDVNALGGALEAATQGIIEPVLIGPRQKIEAAAQALEQSLDGIDVINTEHSHEAAARAVDMAKHGEVDALMKGHIHTDELMHAVLDRKDGIRTDRVMSHTFVMDVPNYHKPLLITDAAININPNLQQKRDIVQNAVDLFHALHRSHLMDASLPKVALVSAVETVNEKMLSTLDASALCKMAERGQITGALLDGPLALDNAISKAAADKKGIVSQVAGDADIIVVPDIESGNMLYKQMRYLSNVEGAGVVLGARVPIILTSRAAGIGQTRLASCALAWHLAKSPL